MALNNEHVLRVGGFDPDPKADKVRGKLSYRPYLDFGLNCKLEIRSDCL